ncbi:MAG: GNAT family N-acetyltransferase [Actinomycetota bacterium]|nr:GNAT family N-acetyltransferase [Actinomycetota bacterium]
MSVSEDAAEYLVRSARAHDVEQVLDLLEQVAAEGRWIGTETPIDRIARRRQISETIEGGDQAARFVADADGDVVGNLWIDLRSYNVAELGMVVSRQWRRRGVGSALMDAGLGWARSAGAHKVALQVWPHNHGALALYRKFGFVQEGLLRRHYPRRNGELWDAVVMGLVLDGDAPGSSWSE